MVARRRPARTEPFVRVVCADVLEGLRGLPDGSIHCVVTSPPYWGLRDYGMGRDQIGLESSPEEYVARLVAVFREVRRVLRDDGSVWLNLGDSYNGYNGNRGTESQYAGHRNEMEAMFPSGYGLAAKGLKSKDLVGIPWRVAFALQADGWYLRQDIIWSKPNPMPESVTDRCTKAHEYIFLLTMSAKYYYDAEAVKESSLDVGRENGREGRTEDERARPPGSNPRKLARLDYTGVGRNKRSVWTVASQPYAEAHFATFPPALIEPCVLAGTSARGCCPDCGAPWQRVVAHTPMKIRRSDRTHELGRTRSSGTVEEPATTRTEGWFPSCSCAGLPPLPDYPDEPADDDVSPSEQRAYKLACGRIAQTRAALFVLAAELSVVPAVVLDPFGGAGTTGLVASRLNRSAVLLDLNPKYCEMAAKRIRDDAPFLAHRVEYG